MIALGLTGSIGMGKSTVAAMFAEAGVPVFDADAEVRRLQGADGAALAAIEAAFPGVTGPGGVDRNALGAAVFGNAAARTRLEAIVHPAVHEAERTFRRRHTRAPLIVLDVPLLFETGGSRRCDAVAVVSAPPRVQRARLAARGVTPARLSAIRAAQMPDREKRRRADFLIPTGGSKRATRRAVRALVSCLRAHGVRYCRTCAKSSSIPRRRG